MNNLTLKIQHSTLISIFASVQIKDYYTILELTPSASLDEIKKAYRRLAHIYHPDKKGDDPYAIAQFSEIKEAYEVLTNPLKKAYYLQQRWYTQSMGRRAGQELITPVTILKQILELDKYVSTLDIYRMDKEGLYHYMINILSTDTVRKLNTFKELSVNKEIILAALSCAQVLPLPLASRLVEHLKQLETEPEVYEKMDELLYQKRNNNQWDKIKIWFVVAVVIVLCVVIFFTAKS